jgi:hypothetical protein
MRERRNRVRRWKKETTLPPRKGKQIWFIGLSFGREKCVVIYLVLLKTLSLWEFLYWLCGTRQRSWLRRWTTRRKDAGSIHDEIIGFYFSIYLILPAALGLGVYSAFNRNE